MKIAWLSPFRKYGSGIGQFSAAAAKASSAAGTTSPYSPPIWVPRTSPVARTFPSSDSPISTMRLSSAVSTTSISSPTTWATTWTTTETSTICQESTAAL